MQLSIIIPALNEEQSIASIIERSLAARKHIIANTSLTSVEIIVVNDGSKDQTGPIASRYNEITLISYEKNKGYGAAIKMGFERGSGDLVGFLDADGTCDPNFFADLVNILEQTQSDIALGSRLGPESKMPPIRRLGNILYAKLINFLGSVKITDSASGMRVIRKNALAKLYPLPDGLHFTPAMSAKALMHNDLKIVEIPMSYQEREGESKLSVLKDGIRFLQTITEMGLFYKPLRCLVTIGLFFIILGSLYSIKPVAYYLTYHRIEDYFIYRLISISVAFLVGLNFIIFGVFAQRFVNLMNYKTDIFDQLKGSVWNIFVQSRYVFILGTTIAVSGILLNANGIYYYLTTAHVPTHWVFILCGAFLVLTGMEIIVFSFLHKILNIYKEQNNW